MMMNVVSALMVTRMLTRDHNSVDDVILGNESIPFGTISWYAYAGISCFLVLFAGIMSGLTLGLMSLSLVDLEILERSGSPSEKKQAGTINPSFLSSINHESSSSSSIANCFLCIILHSDHTSGGSKTTPASCHSASL